MASKSDDNVTNSNDVLTCGSSNIIAVMAIPSATIPEPTIACNIFDLGLMISSKK
jgi:hypothetical protein